MYALSNLIELLKTGEQIAQKMQTLKFGLVLMIIP